VARRPHRGDQAPEEIGIAGNQVGSGLNIVGGASAPNCSLRPKYPLQSILQMHIFGVHQASAGRMFAKAGLQKGQLFKE
jgi:hypothetical protein